MPSPATRLPYDDASSPREMSADARRCGARLRRRSREIAARAAAPAPGLGYDDHPREVPKRDIAVSAAAQRLANALQLHLD